MKTIGFYSYGGDSKRNKTALLISFAKYLTERNMSVFLMDSNIPSPELQDKVQRAFGQIVQSERGLVDAFRVFQIKGQAPDEMMTTKYLSCVTDTKLRLLLASGKHSISEYARKSVSIDYRLLPHEKEGGGGILFLQWLRRQIERTYEPDYLLIDTPSMFSEIGSLFLMLASCSVWMPTNDTSGGLEFCMQNTREFGWIKEHNFRVIEAGEQEEDDRELFESIMKDWNYGIV